MCNTPRDRPEKNPATPIGLGGDVAAGRPRRHPGARSRPDLAGDRSTGSIPAPEPPPPVRRARRNPPI